MSQENLEVVRRGNAAFNRGDYDRFAESWHPEIEFRDLAHAADAPETLRGAQTLLSLMSEWRESFDDFRAEISEYIEAGDNLVCVTRWTGTGEGERCSRRRVPSRRLRAARRKGRPGDAWLPDKATALDAVRE